MNDRDVAACMTDALYTCDGTPEDLVRHANANLDRRARAEQLREAIDEFEFLYRSRGLRPESVSWFLLPREVMSKARAIEARKTPPK